MSRTSLLKRLCEWHGITKGHYLKDFDENRPAEPFKFLSKIAATITDDIRRNVLIDHLIDHFPPESDLRPERWLRLFGNFISLIVGLLTSALLLWLIYDSYIDGNYDFAKTVLTSGIGGAVIGSIATYYFQRGDK